MSKYHKKLTKEQIDLLEKLADIEHQRWADWQLYLHSKLQYTEWKDKEGNTIAGYIMQAGDYEHWQSQIERGYDELSEAEKDSDREQVMKYFNLIK